MTGSVLALAVLGLVAQVSLVPNGSFEEGDERGPAKWDRPDGLTSFWEKDPERDGRCVRLFTRVSIDDFHRRLEEMKQPVPPPPQPPRPVKGGGAGTVGGLDGVSYYTDWIPVKPGMRYALSVAVRSEGGKPKVFVKGYSEISTEVDQGGVAAVVSLRRPTYKTWIDCAGGPRWRTTTHEFSPTHDRDDVRWMRVMLYAYWPPQNYWFDDVKVVEAGADLEAPARWAAAKEKARREAFAEAEGDARAARAAMAAIRRAVERYKRDLGSFPRSLRALTEDPGDERWAGPYVLEVGDDPWGRPFVYAADERGYRLRSLGPDGKEGTSDDVE